MRIILWKLNILLMLIAKILRLLYSYFQKHLEKYGDVFFKKVPVEN